LKRTNDKVERRIKREKRKRQTINQKHNNTGKKGEQKIRKKYQPEQVIKEDEQKRGHSRTNHRQRVPTTNTEIQSTRTFFTMAGENTGLIQYGKISR